MCDWQFLFVEALAVFPSRWATFWYYVLRGKKPHYSLQAWVKPQNINMAEITLYLKWQEEKGGKNA